MILWFKIHYTVVSRVFRKVENAWLGAYTLVLGFPWVAVI